MTLALHSNAFRRRVGSLSPKPSVRTPIRNEPDCATAACHAHPESQTVLGVLDVTIPLAEVDRNLRHSKWTAVILAITAIAVLSLIVVIMVRWWIDRPVRSTYMHSRYLILPQATIRRQRYVSCAARGPTSAPWLMTLALR